MTQHDAHVRDLRELQRRVEQMRRARYRREDNNHDGRPRVDKLARGAHDPLVEALKKGKR